MITHLCKTCETSVDVARVDVTMLGRHPQFMWGMHERCTTCGSTARPLEVVDANDHRLGRGQWEATTTAQATSGHLACGYCATDGMAHCPLHGSGA